MDYDVDMYYEDRYALIDEDYYCDYGNYCDDDEYEEEEEDWDCEEYDN